jgi:regulator of sigma E protease
MLLTIIVFIIILSVLVLIHEAGHFITAKLFGIKVEEFGFGIPPRAFGIKFGETLYSINWLPIGGFVKLYGEDEAGAGRIQAAAAKPPKNLKRAFFARPIWQRATVVIAGVCMNFFLAAFLLSFLFAFVGVPSLGNKVSVDQVMNGSPAQKSGLKAGDLIEAINGKQIKNPEEVLLSAKNNAGKEINFKIKTSKGVEKVLKITPRINYPKSQGPMGIVISQSQSIKKYPWYMAPIEGVKEAIKETWLILTGLGSLVFALVTKGTIPSDIAGPVGIAQLTGKVVEIGPYAILSFVSLLSLNLAIINILPIPALDGGRLFFILVEAVTRKKVNSTFENYAHMIGMIILLLLIGLITLHDIIKILTGQPILPGL